MKYNCLIVDDEVELAKATCEYFEMFGITAQYVTDSKSCISFLGENEADTVLLDINLGQESGFMLCKQLRENYQMPILFISARQSDDDILIGLNIGGDDYIKKPYSLSVLLAKVKVILKRIEEHTKSSERIEDSVPAGLVVDESAMRVFVDGREIILKSKEFRLLAYLYQNKNQVVTKDRLFANVWGDEFFSDGTLNVHIRKIREKIEANPNEPKYIKTIWGTGYRLEI